MPTSMRGRTPPARKWAGPWRAAAASAGCSSGRPSLVPTRPALLPRGRPNRIECCAARLHDASPAPRKDPAMSMADRDGKIWMDGTLVEWRDAKIHELTHTLHYG